MSNKDGNKQSREPKKQAGKRRLSRNESEKLRRDKLNNHIAELAKLVPMVASANRKLDKSSVLRLSVNYLRLHNEVKKSKEFELWRPEFLTQENLGALLLEAYDGFLIVVSQKGIILYVSDLITTFLGHSQMDILGLPIYQLIHPDDVGLCKEQFQTELSPKPASKKMMPSSPDNAENIDQWPDMSGVYSVPGKDRRSFCLRMQNVTNRDQITYDVVQFSCHVRSFQQPSEPGSMSDSTVVIGVGRLTTHQPIKELCVLPSTVMEFVTQHSMDGSIVYANQQYAVCTGRLPHEVYGTSVYDFIVQEDIKVVEFSHQRIIIEGSIPTTVFRSFTPSGSVVCLQSHSIICCDNWTKLPKYILSNNVVISETEFDVLMLRQKEKMGMLTSGSCDDGTDTSQTDNFDDSDAEEDVKKQRLEPLADSQPSLRGLLSLNVRELENLSQGTCSIVLTPEGRSQSDSLSPSQSTGNKADHAVTHSEMTRLYGISSAPGQTPFIVHNNNNSPNSLATETLQSSSVDLSAAHTKDRTILANLLHGPGPSEDGKSVSNTITNADEMRTTSASSPSAHFSCDTSETFTDSESVGVSSTGDPDGRHQAEAVDVKTWMAQSQLSRQLEDKYHQLETSMERQERELSDLRDNMLKYLLSHPHVQEGYLKRLQTLEAKRKQHQSKLRRLQELHDSQRKGLHSKASPASKVTPTSCTVTSESAMTLPAADEHQTSPEQEVCEEDFPERQKSDNDTRLPETPLNGPDPCSDGIYIGPRYNPMLSTVAAFQDTLLSLPSNMSVHSNRSLSSMCSALGLNLGSDISYSIPPVPTTCPVSELNLSSDMSTHNNPSVLNLSSDMFTYSNLSVSNVCPVSQLNSSSEMSTYDNPSGPSMCPVSQLNLSSNMSTYSNPPELSMSPHMSTHSNSSVPSRCPVSQLNLSPHMSTHSNPSELNLSPHMSTHNNSSVPSRCPVTQLNLSPHMSTHSNPSELNLSPHMSTHSNPSELNLSPYMSTHSNSSVPSRCPVSQLNLSPHMSTHNNSPVPSMCPVSQLNLSSNMSTYSNPSELNMSPHMSTHSNSSVPSMCPVTQLNLSPHMSTHNNSSVPSMCPVSQLNLSSNMSTYSNPSELNMSPHMSTHSNSSVPSMCPVTQLNLSPHMSTHNNSSVPSMCPVSQLNSSSNMSTYSNPSELNLSSNTFTYTNSSVSNIRPVSHQNRFSASVCPADTTTSTSPTDCDTSVSDDAV